MSGRGKRDTYKEIQHMLGGCRPFVGNSLSAVGDPDSKYGYQVFSYTVEVARVWRDANGRLNVWHDSEHHTQTTTRGQNMCKRWLPGIPRPTLPGLTVTL